MRERGVTPFTGFCLGIVLALGWGFRYSSTYVAETSLIFPTVNAGVLKLATQALSVDGSAVEWNHTSELQDARNQT